MMSEEDQLRLLDWLETRSRRIQIVSTTSSPLQPSVESGGFNDVLYFRLNTVRIDL
jgi:transcriptional regulator of acetoin/glycerol metabolism